MKTLIPQRERFHKPELLSPAWALKKGVRLAECSVWSHQFGFELRLTIAGDPLPRTQVCPSHEDLIELQETWRAALEMNGWSTQA